MAVDDAAATPLNTPYTFRVTGDICTGSGLPCSLTANDTDADIPHNPLRVIEVSAPAHGTATLNATGTVTYTPVVGFTGTDSFTYNITDGLLSAFVPGNVTMTVGSHPTANPDTATVLEGNG